MKHLSSTLWPLSALVFLSGCGGEGASTPTSAPTSSPPPQILNIAGNWQFSTTSTAGMPPLSIGGGIAQSGTSVTTAAHVDGSPCFDPLTTVGLTGTMDGSNISLTSSPIAEQVIAFDGSITEDSVTHAANFTGTYSVHGGCADGDHGNVTGNNMPFIANVLNGTLTSGGQKFDLVADVAQDSHPGAAGSFGITGTVTFTAPCFTSGMIKSGAFPAGSFVIGKSVTLEVETGNGILILQGTADPDKAEIDGDYTVSGGTCDQTGTAILLASSPWDY